MAAAHSRSMISADEALARLQAGNARFVAGQARFPTVQKAILADLAKGQAPYATILGCSDSRVPPELVFDAGFGELFIVRVAGNVLGSLIAGTMQYASEHLHTPLFVVLGHEGCGAVEAAIAHRFDGARFRQRIEVLLESIVVAVDGLDPTLPRRELMRQAVEANVRWTMRRIAAKAEKKAAIAAGLLRLVGAVYELETGRVRFLEPD